jgi:hypothetical protein
LYDDTNRLVHEEEEEEDNNGQDGVVDDKTNLLVDFIVVVVVLVMVPPMENPIAWWWDDDDERAVVAIKINNQVKKKNFFWKSWRAKVEESRIMSLLGLVDRFVIFLLLLPSFSSCWSDERISESQQQHRLTWSRTLTLKETDMVLFPLQVLEISFFSVILLTISSSSWQGLLSRLLLLLQHGGLLVCWKGKKTVTTTFDVH